MADPTLKTALADPKLRPVVLAWAQRIRINDEVDFIVDMLQKKDARQIYRDYVADGAPRSINLGARDLKPARDVVATGKFKPTDLRSALVEITQKQFAWLQPSFSTGNSSFLTSPEYQTYLTAGVTRDPKVALALTSLNLPAAKTKALEPFLTLYLKARTVEDAYQAYAAMQKIAAKAKLDVALTAAGKSADDVTRDYQVGKLVTELKPMLAEAKRYLEGALKTIKAQGNSKNPIEVTRMFNSGRMRVEKVTTPYTKAARLDPGFAGKYGPVAAEKKKIDELWADYRKALGK